MKPRYVTGWVAKRNVDMNTDTGELTVEVTLELRTDRGGLFLIFEPDPAANIGWDLLGEATGFAYNSLPDQEDAEGT
jgi:hypothetical protein